MRTLTLSNPISWRKYVPIFVGQYVTCVSENLWNSHSCFLSNWPIKAFAIVITQSSFPSGSLSLLASNLSMCLLSHHTFDSFDLWNWTTEVLICQNRKWKSKVRFLPQPLSPVVPLKLGPVNSTTGWSSQSGLSSAARPLSLFLRPQWMPLRREVNNG